MDPVLHSILVIVIVLGIVGLLLWGLSQIPGLPPVVKTVAYVVIGIILLVWLLNAVGGGSVFR